MAMMFYFVLCIYTANKFDEDCPMCQKNYQINGVKKKPSEQSTETGVGDAPPKGTKEYDDLMKNAEMQKMIMINIQNEADNAEVKAQEAKSKQLKRKLHTMAHEQNKINAQLSKTAKHDDIIHYEYKQPVTLHVFTPTSIPFRAHQLLALGKIMKERHELANALEKDKGIIRTITTHNEMKILEGGTFNVPTNPHSAGLHKLPIKRNK